MRNRLPLFLVKVFYYEYWPFWLFFLPLVPYWLYLAIKCRSLTFFTAANPGIKHGGVFGESKMDILDQLNPKFLPKATLIKRGENWTAVIQMMEKLNLNFPIILKPNIGERGADVAKINNQQGLVDYVRSANYDFIIQEFVGFPIELGVLYYRYPNTGQTGISSIVQKEFLQIEGDGRSTLKALVFKNERAKLQWDNIKLKFGERLQDVLPKGEKLELEPIGNHCKGTKFLSGMDLIDNDLVKVFDEVAADSDDFYYGRFDLKVSSVEDLRKGENIRVMEFNGVTSEPGHIYDPKLNLLVAYRDVIRGLNIMAEISRQNMKSGVAVTPAMELLREIKTHFGRKRQPANTEAKLKAKTVLAK
ncbi:hypothetical protein [Roseivirga pacifica]|uniref:hypothetical protein n=1 Tax=Roseivirga pacifica TaxID=1267423 RepID=UPI0020954CE0|nr:hypothetical protein [Roseivirga pacifica]MCO6359881.1 hypothetical protein [Roseivirga pacifica]MCO6367251.1 hypothetical protein [Roseivirga pacifica]MCO6370217.1 hypothetical protein [Roseivirga pacifica]MCO6374908.1 hypothetical protein [Roseivirga pacifica]MCO6380166.1 hypothetical protein [Roseivirga pacifica]